MTSTWGTYLFENGIDMDELEIYGVSSTECTPKVEALKNANGFTKSLLFRPTQNDALDYTKFIDANGKFSLCEELQVNNCNWHANWDKIDNWTNLSLLSNSNTLKRLRIGWCYKEDISFLNNFTFLELLEIQGSKIKNINGISNFTNLQYLSITSCKITDITEIGKIDPNTNKPILNNLRLLDFNNNNISKGIENLEKLTNLELINLQSNNLGAIDRYVDQATGRGTDTFVNIFKTLHEQYKLKELYLLYTNVKNIDGRLRNSTKEWGSGVNSYGNNTQFLQCDS